MCIIFGFAETWISQDERLGTMCRFVVAKTKLRKPILREGSFELLSSNFKQRRNDEFFFSHCVWMSYRSSIWYFVIVGEIWFGVVCAISNVYILIFPFILHLPSLYNIVLTLREKWVFSGPYFPAFGLVSLRIQLKCRKTRIRKNSVFGHFSRSVNGNKFAQVRNIARHFYLSSLKHAVDSLLDRIFLGVRYKNRIS